MRLGLVLGCDLTVLIITSLQDNFSNISISFFTRCSLLVQKQPSLRISPNPYSSTEVISSP